MPGSEPKIRRDSRLFVELCSALLKGGYRVRFRAQGESMRPNILHGDDVLVAPTQTDALHRGDVVLAENAGGLVLHRIASLDPATGDALLRSDTGEECDPATRQIFGKALSLRRGAEEKALTFFQTRCIHPLRARLYRFRAAAKLKLRRVAVLFSTTLPVILMCGALFAFAPATHAQTADLQLTQTASASAVASGSNFTYTEVVKNNTSSATVTGGTITVYMQTPANTVYESNTGQATLGTATSATWAANVATYTFASVPSNVVVGSLLTTAGFAPTGYNVTNAVITGSTATTVTVAMTTNPGRATASTNGTGTATVWGCTTPAVGGTGPIVCTYEPTLASGATASTLTVTFQVSAGTTAGTAVQSSTTVTNSTFSDTVPSNNTSITSIVVEPAASSDLALSMGVAPTPVFVSSNFTYTLQIQNLGQATAPATSNVLTDTLPSGLTNVSVSSASGWTCSGTTTVTCSSVALASGATATVTITATAPANATTLNNTATVSLSGDPNSNNNSATAYTVVQPIACASPGHDGAAGTLTGVVNTYYPPSSQGVLASASTSVTLGTALGNTSKPIATGDLVLIIQMQGAAINSTNTSSYGDGVPGDPGSGSAAVGSSGLFEFVTATGFTAGTPNTLTFTGTGPTGGLLNNYYEAAPLNAVSLGTASAASWSGNVATFTFPTPLPTGVIPYAALTTTGFVPTGYNLTSATILTANSSTGVVTVALTTNPGTVTTRGTGTASSGQHTYQVIRVPQYLSATLSSGLVPLAWNGSVGGVLALDVSSQLTLGGTVALDALGFRGAGGQILTGPSVGGTDTPTDYITGSPTSATTLTGANGGKGEGIAGTPRYVAPATIGVTSVSTDAYGGTLTDSLPVGSYARGAPGNAGGGGTDGDPPNNDENSGGGGGGNGGSGGQGGYGWNSMASTNSTDGGFGGVAFPASTSALVMGGAGGAGTTNNGSYYISATNNGSTDDGNCGTGNVDCTGIYSSGGHGGAIAIIHAGSVTGTGAISSNGESTLSTLRDSTGGAGAGGSILVFANSGGLGGLTVSATGGSAGNAWPNQAPGGFPGDRHGPGGGGGGGVIFLTATPASSNIKGGLNGFTDTVQDSYGAIPGQSGVLATTHLITETPGTQSGAYCGSADLSVTNSGPTVVLAGNPITYSQTVANAGPLDAVNAIFSESIPANTTFGSVTPPTGWTCNPAPTTTLTCSNPDFPAKTSGTFSVTVNVTGGTPAGTQIVDVDNITSGTTDPNLANNSATVTTAVGIATQADLAVNNTVSASSVTVGSTFTMTSVVSNNGPAAGSGLVFTEATATDPTGTINATFSSISAPGWTCITPAVGTAGTIACTLASLSAGANAGTIVITETAPSATAGTLLTGTASISAQTLDPNYSNNSATASIEIANAGQADLVMSSSATPNPVTAGNNITYTQTVTNNGPTAITISGATTVTFTDTIPANTTLVSFTPPVNWNCNTIAVGGTGTFTCTLNSTQTLSVGAGSAVSFPLVVKVNSGTVPGTTITNSPNITSTVSDPNSANNTATAVTVVASPTQSSVNITKSASPEPVNQGTVLTYTITVTNGGPAAATGNFTVTDVLPPEVTYINNAYSTSAGSCSGTTTVTCNIGSLPVGSTVAITIDVTATTFSASSLSTNTATLTTNTTVTNAPTSLGTATAASWASNVASFTFALPLPASLSTSSTLTTSGFAPAGYNVSNAAITSVNTATGVVTVALATNPGTATALGAGSAYIPYPLIAQSVSTIQAPTAVDIASINAYSQPDGTVRVVWHTLEESRNLGFHVYREDATGQHRVDASMIAGSALTLRGSRPQHAAKWYSWIDPHPAPDASYWIQDVDINGTRTMHGPAYPEAASNTEIQPRGATASVQAITPSPTLSQLRSNAVSTVSRAPRPMIPVRIGPWLPPPGTVPFNVADHAAVQISVDQEGWYHVPFSQLFAAGLTPYTDVRLLHLYAEGVEQPILLTGRAAGFPASTDAIEFYGTGIDTPFSGTRVYWLISENSYSKRVLPAPATAAAGPAGPSFPFTTMREDRTTYFAALLNGENNDNFFGDVVTNEPVDELLTVTHRDTSSTQPLTLTLTLQGATDQQLHSVAVLFNGSNVGTFDFYGMTLASQSFTVDPSLALDGTNDVNLTALNGDNDVSLVQSVQLNYLHTYTADSDWLRATAPAGTEVQITGFTNPGVRLFDITNPLNIVELTGTVSTQSGVSTIAAAIPGGAPQTRTILAVAQDTLSVPSSLTAYAPSFLEDQRSGADIVIITYPDFASHLAPLVRLHSQQGYKVLQATTDQLFDEFNYGERSPFAIRAFLQQAATQWQRKPKAVLLVGDASVDPRNYLGLGDFDFVPTRIIETAAFKTASDDWFSDFQQAGYATIPTGRLPVRTTDDVDLVVSKIVNYESGENGGNWSNQALLVADQNLDANFSAAVTAAAAALPSSLQSTQILTDGMDPSTARSQVLAALNSGALIVDFNGHGAEQQWSFSDLFDGNDAAALANGGHLPVYLLMDCLNGLFQDIYAQALAKSLILAPNGGAVAVWASSGFTQQPPQASMELALLNELSAHPNEMLGLMVLRAKSGTSDNDVRRTWILFGDPAMKLRMSASAPGSAPPVSSDPPRPIRPPHVCSRGVPCALEKLQ